MSFQAMTWACEQDLPCNQKMVLMMLANRTNHDTGRCDPSHKRLAKDCGMSTATLKRCIKKLEEDGFLEVICRKNGDVNLPNQYQLNLPGVGSQRTQGGVTENPGWGHGDPRGGVTVSYKPGSNNQEVNQEDNQAPNPSSPDGDPATKKAKKRSHAMPDDFSPEDSHREKANRLGLDLEHEVEQFTNFHLSKGSTFVDWGRALHTWLGNASKFAKQAPSRAARPMHDLNSLDHANDPMMGEDGRLAPEPRRNR